MSLEWNVYWSNFNKRNIETHNVFNHYSLMKDCAKNYKNNKDNKEEFLKQLRRDLKYYYWAKCEWEILLLHWPPRDSDKTTKIDVYDQIAINWPRFSEYVWENREEFKSKKKKAGE